MSFHLRYTKDNSPFANYFTVVSFRFKKLWQENFIILNPSNNVLWSVTCRNVRMTIRHKFFSRAIYLSCHQSGFRSLHSTLTALIEATDSWALDIDRGLVNAVVFLDLKKAFDTVDHDILLRKLQYYGICWTSHQWFASYLDNRIQICHINSCKSTPKCLRCGVPQGTILGPLLFLIYINDLPHCLTYSEPRMYADDTSLTLASTDIEHINYRLNHDLRNVYEWLSANKLTLNMTKTEFMLIASRQKLSQFTESPSLTINENAIEQVTSAKSLGVYVDQNINWECHIENISIIALFNLNLIIAT